MKKQIKHTIAKLAFAAALLCTPVLHADFTFFATIDTSVMGSDPNSPFYLDFQLNQGDGPLGNTVTIGNFQFTNGAAVPATAVTFGDVSGDLSSSVVLTDSANPFNEFYQAFTATTTSIVFQVTMTQNPGILTPDEFTVAVLDNTTFQIPTDNPDGVSLLSMSITAANTAGDIVGSESTDPEGVTAIPEPSTWAMLSAGAILVVAVGLRRKNRLMNA